MSCNIPTALSAEHCAIRTHGLTKHFGSHHALAGVDFTIPEHAFYVLVGPNGAGKTTFFKVLLDLILPTAGVVDVMAMDPRREGARVRAHVGYVPESSADLYTWMTVDQAFAFHRAYFPSWDDQYAEELRRRLEVKPGRLQRLSKGEARRVQLVFALAHRPPVLLLDEPSDGLDPRGRELLYGILAEHMATTPTTVVVSTHLVFELEHLADHLAVLNSGRIVAQIPTELMRTQLKRYVFNGGGASTPPPDAAVALTGSERERAWTLWGDETELAGRLRASGAEIRDIRPLTLNEAAVAFLGRNETATEVHAASIMEAV